MSRSSVILSRERYLSSSSTNFESYILGSDWNSVSKRSGPVSLANIVVTFVCSKSPPLSTSRRTLFFAPYSVQKGANWSIAAGRQLRKLIVTSGLFAAGLASPPEATPSAPHAASSAPVSAAPDVTAFRRVVRVGSTAAVPTMAVFLSSPVQPRACAGGPLGGHPARRRAAGAGSRTVRSPCERALSQHTPSTGAA